MEERIQALTPSILIIAGIALGSYIYLKVVRRRLAGVLQSVDSTNKNRWKLSFLLGSPALFICAPTLEELFFRTPLLLAFSRVDNRAWYGIITSAVLFGAMHWRGHKLTFDEITEHREKHPESTDNPEEIITEISTLKRTRVLVAKIVHVTITTGLGALIGYYGIKHQSLWLCVGLHAAWNLVGSVILVILVSFIAFLVSMVFLLGDALRRIVVETYRRRASAARRRKYQC